MSDSESVFFRFFIHFEITFLFTSHNIEGLDEIMIENAAEDDIPKIRNLMQSETGFWQDSWRPEVLDLAIQSANGLAFV
jgi:hypothetical protein